MEKYEEEFKGEKSVDNTFHSCHAGGQMGEAELEGSVPTTLWTSSGLDVSH